MKRYIFLEHTADIKFQAFGKNLNELFENSCLAMFHSMQEGRIKSKIKKEIKIKGKDLENLMYNFLEEFLFLFDTEGFFVSKIKVKIKGKELVAKIEGDLAKNYEMNTHVKAVTYNDMFVRKEKEKWISQVVLDV